MRLYHAVAFLIAIALLTFSNLFASHASLLPVPDSLAVDTFPPPRNLDGLTQDDAVQLWWEAPVLTAALSDRNPEAFVPDNLMGYMIYRNNALLDYIEYTGNDTSHYWDFMLPPDTYEYRVTALYDLTPAGMPGDTAESEPAGPISFFAGYSFVFPFVEDWNTGSFDPNLWTYDENWVINGQNGKPLPCAEFKWDPVLTDYISSLSSYWLDGKHHPNSQYPYVDGRFWLDFDIALDNVNATGNELLVVEVCENETWHTVDAFDNLNGSFDWTSRHIEITNLVFGEVFNVRFRAEGANSSDILSWFIDNINIYRQCDAPTDLWTIEVSTYAIDLHWSPPDMHEVGDWIRWDNGSNVGAIGLTGGGTFSVASRWEPDMIAQYAGMMLTKMRFVPGADAGASDYSIKVWEGPNAETLLHEEAMNGLISGDWNEIILSTPVAIDVSKELWFGYTCVSADGDFPAGHDAGPAVVNYGDMITLNGMQWEPISSYGSQYDLNWNIQAFAGYTTVGTGALLGQKNDNTVYTGTEASFVRTAAEDPVDPHDAAGRQLTGYNIYWNNDNGGYELLDFTPDTFYHHVNSQAFLIGTIHCYYVTAEYEDCNPASEEACQSIGIGIEESSYAGQCSVYPNPASELLYVEVKGQAGNYMLRSYNMFGMMEDEIKQVPGRKISTLNVSRYPDGVYILLLYDDQRCVGGQKFVVRH